MSTVLREAPHRCELPIPREGEIRRCDHCGATWLGHQPPNPDYIRWTRVTWLGRKLRGLP